MQYFPPAKQYVQDSQPGYRPSGIPAGYEGDQPGPVELVSGHEKKVVFGPRTMPGKIDEKDADLKTDQYEEYDCELSRHCSDCSPLARRVYSQPKRPDRVNVRVTAN
jgi:hypothetical protein